MLSAHSRCVIRLSKIKKSPQISSRGKSEFIKRRFLKLDKSSASHEPPLPVRVALVSTSTALCTPIFPAIGFINAVLRVMVSDSNLRNKLNGSIGTIVNIAFYYVLPYSYQYSSLLLPFAISNGICAGFGYATLDLVSGGPSSRIMKNPYITGGGIGALTGLVAPHLLYGQLYSMMYGAEEISDVIHACTSISMFTQISCATGFVAGSMMYPILHYPIFGVEGIHWVGFAGVTLLICMGTAIYIYSPEKQLPLEKGSFVCPSQVPLLDAIIRYDVNERNFRTFSLSTNEWVGPFELIETGKLTAKEVRNYQSSRFSRKVHTFDNQVLAFLSRWDNNVATAFPDNLVTVKDEKELQYIEEIFYRTDLVVDFVMERNGTDYIPLNDRVEMLLHFGRSISEKERTRRIKAIEGTSVGVELLFALRDHSEDKPFLLKQNDSPSIDFLEKWVRKRAPGILLYKEDEQASDLRVTGESVESQLDSLMWRSRDVKEVHDHWVRLNNDEKKRNIAHGAVIASSVLASLAAMALTTSN